MTIAKANTIYESSKVTRIWFICLEDIESIDTEVLTIKFQLSGRSIWIMQPKGSNNIEVKLWTFSKTVGPHFTSIITGDVNMGMKALIDHIKVMSLVPNTGGALLMKRLCRLLGFDLNEGGPSCGEGFKEYLINVILLSWAAYKESVK